MLPRFISLQNLIIKQDAHALDDTSKQNLQRHVLKLTKAVQTFFAKDARHTQPQALLYKINTQ